MSDNGGADVAPILISECAPRRGGVALVGLKRMSVRCLVLPWALIVRIFAFTSRWNRPQQRVGRALSSPWKGEVTTIMSTGRFFYSRAARIFAVAVVVMGTWLLPGGTVNAAPPQGAYYRVANSIAQMDTATTIEPPRPPCPVRLGTRTTLTATVRPANARGRVQFRDWGSKPIDGMVPVRYGRASMTTMLASGGHQLTAQFLPDDPTAYKESTSPFPQVCIVNPS
jgi:hypothetical protein